MAKYRPYIVGITGSAGKSSAVHATAVVLATKYRVQATQKGNSETGIGFELLKIPVENYASWQWGWVLLRGLWSLIFYWPNAQVFVAEMGIDSDQEPKNMVYHLRVLQPKIGVLLNASSVHGQNFAGPDIVQAIANEKARLLHAIPDDGLAIFSADHQPVVTAAQGLHAPYFTFASRSKKADMFLKTYRVTIEGTTFDFEFQKKTYTLQFKHQCHTQAAFGSYAAALLTGYKLGISIEAGITALEQNLHLKPGRMSLFRGIKQTTILDSSYNSSPEATREALLMLSQIPSKGKRIAVLGDMRELGLTTQAEHEALAEVAAKHADTIILVGPLMKQYALTALTKKKFPAKHLHSFITAWEAIDLLKEIIAPQDLILIKGSQNTIFLEIIVEALLANPEKDLPHLCRRGKYWDERREALKLVKHT